MLGTLMRARLEGLLEKRKPSGERAGKDVREEGGSPDPDKLAKLDWAPLPSGQLSGKQRKVLKELAHHLKPTARIGQEGVTDAVVAELRKQLLSHELIKVKWSGLSREEGNKKEQAAALAQRVGAHLVHLIGQAVVLYREPDPDVHPRQPKRVQLPQ